MSAFRVTWAAVLVCIVCVTDSNAQFPPDTLQNLKVLPADITPRELIGVMRSFAGGLGVRCQFCHIGEEGQPLEEFDFVSDDKETKRKAREMIKMVRAINETHLANLDGRSDPPIIVGCETCHRGVSKPKRIEDILLATLNDHGTDSTIAEYRKLREQYYGGFSYDFSERMLMLLGNDLVREADGPGDRQRRLDGAVAMLRLNLEFYPESGFTHFILGEAHRLRGDTTDAISSFERAVELMPGNQLVQQRLQQLRGN